MMISCRWYLKCNFYKKKKVNDTETNEIWIVMTDIAGDKLGEVTSGTVQGNQEKWQQSDIEGSPVEILRDVSSHPPTEVQVINNSWDYGE